ncbi:TlpA family protein disulfide reductase [Leeia sp. TBRC 13508]|uniref:TlpA family protein disulfide reductase n=1 Tax=Leeia speluncae TaxID=2884804 RepID=A0ABS8D497_9NEIS|nr:TlpA disulfide reductase family protein [Leeia speluncae]MCB6182991.1 TlpA family protein disulfide reductase [Leeia speluncae]
MASRNRSFIATAILAILLLAGGAGYFLLSSHSPTAKTPKGVPAEVLWQQQLPDLDGKLRKLSDWRGNKVVVVNFWASWCPPCQQELPGFVHLQQQFADKDVQFIGIALDNANNVNLFMQHTPINFPVLLAEAQGASMMASLGNEAGALPYTLVLNSAGNIQHLQLGMLSEDKLLPILQQMVGDQ